MREINKSYKFRIYPTDEQKELMAKTFGCCRFVYNHFLEERMTRYKETGKSPSAFDQIRELTTLKDEYPWLREVDSTALQASIQALDAAYQNFFRRVKNHEKPGYPKFKSKYDNHLSYKSKSVKLSENAVRLPKLGWIDCRVSREVEGRILSGTVSKNPSGEYYIALNCAEVPVEDMPRTGSVVGLSMGIQNFATTSDGVHYPNPRYYESTQRKLAKLQRQMSRKQKGSNRYEKARIKVARCHEQIANQRRDMLQKLSTELVRENDIICIKDADIQRMMQEGFAAKAISDASWGEFRRELEYKAGWYGKAVVAVDKFYPSNQICSNCGEKNPKAKNSSLRQWTCPKCGMVHDRGKNAAINVLNEGMRQAFENQAAASDS